jgi:tetratricopeptide (TPR) repeat protein
MSQPVHLDDHAFIRAVNKEIDDHPELSAASADWQKIVDMVREAAVRSHRLAAMVMHEYQATKRPFVLYLRSFESEAYQYTDGPGASGQPTKMWSTQHGATAFEKRFAAAIGDRLPVLGIANPSALLIRAVVPRLQLRNEGWQQVARNLIEHAAFIVMECDALAPGVIWELEAIRDSGRQDETIIVLPPKSGDRDGASLGDLAATLGATVTQRHLPAPADARFAAFQRVLSEDAIDFDHLADAPQFHDVMTRALGHAAAAPPFDPKAYATYLNNQGVAHFNKKEYPAAIGAYDQALLVRRCINDRDGLVTTLMNIGSVLIDGGQPEDSLTFLTEAHELARELGRAADQGIAAAYIGIAHKAGGNLREAIRWLGDALPIVETASPAELKHVLVHLGVAYEDLGDLANATACARRLKELGAI